MASEYSLNLKATLDSSQVQQELQKLRQAQMAANNGTGQNGTGSGGMGNLTKLDTAITKLNSTVAGLQRSIESLARTLGRPVQGGPAGSFSTSVGGRGIPVAAGPMQTNSIIGWLSSDEYKRANSIAQNYIRSLSPLERQAFIARYGHRGIPNLNTLVMKGAFGQEQKQQYMAAQKAWRKGIQASSGDGGFDGRDRKIASMIGGQLIGGAADMATGFGFSKTGAVLQGVGQGVTAGGGAAFAMSMMGATAAAGPVGLIVGLGTAAAAVTKALDDLRVAAAKAAEQQRQVAQALLQGGWNQSVDRRMMWNRTWAEEAEKTNDLQTAAQQSAYAKRLMNERRLAYNQMEDPYEYAARLRSTADWEKERFGINKDDEAAALYDKAVNERIEAYQKEFDAAKKAYETAQTNFDVWKSVEDRLKAIKEEAEQRRRAVRQDNAVRTKGIVASNRELAYSLMNEDAIRGTEIFAQGVLGEKNGPLSAFKKISEELDSLRQQRREMRSEAFGITRGIQLNGEGMSPNELEDLTRRRDAMLKDADVMAQRISVLENALGNISIGNIAPDLSHVTSLAQYGFNMGERDNGVERMEKYYSESINLQRQIKDKLNEGIKTEATYGD